MASPGLAVAGNQEPWLHADTLHQRGWLPGGGLSGRALFVWRHARRERNRLAMELVGSGIVGSWGS
jgi:hypothetical protein